MSADTPLTDYEAAKESDARDVVPVAFARTLEIRKASLERENARLREALKAIEQRAADNTNDRETVYAVHALARQAATT